MSLKYDIRVRRVTCTSEVHPLWGWNDKDTIFFLKQNWKQSKRRICSHQQRMLVNSKPVRLKRHKLPHLTMDMWGKRS
uniref:Uncharacterized protein n=1 Tax=Glossina pallidipes TaxID=7398 RepID=A0A1B0AJF9_GLOPL